MPHREFNNKKRAYKLQVTIFFAFTALLLSTFSTDGVSAACSDGSPPQNYSVNCGVIDISGNKHVYFSFRYGTDTTGAGCDGPTGFCIHNETPSCDQGRASGTGVACNPKLKGYHLWTLYDLTKGHQVAYVRGDVNQSETVYGVGGVCSAYLGACAAVEHPCQNTNPSYWNYFLIPCNVENSGNNFRMDYWSRDAEGNLNPANTATASCTCPVNTTPGTLPPPPAPVPPPASCSPITGHWTYSGWGACSGTCVNNIPQAGVRTRTAVSCVGASCGGDCGPQILTETCEPTCPYVYPDDHNYRTICNNPDWYKGDPNLLGLVCVIVRLLNVFVLSVGAIFVMFVFISAIKYGLAQGDPKALQGAKQTLTLAIIGMLVVIGAFTILTILRNIFGLQYQILTNPFDVLSDRLATLMRQMNIRWTVPSP